MKMKLTIWILFFLPLFYLIYTLNYYQLADPIKFISDITGITALQFLLTSLTLTPLRSYTKINLIKQRRLLGLMSFFYAFNHMFLYLLLDHELSIIALLEDALDKKFIFFGMAAFSILLFMTLSSTKKLFKKFVKWHQLVYLALVFIAFHYALSQKILSQTSMIYLAIILLLLLLRYKKILKVLKVLR